MKRVPVRSFQLKPYEYLKDLPIMLTRYDKDIAILNRASDSKVPDHSSNINKEVKVTESISLTEELFSDTKIPGYSTYIPYLGKWKKD